MSKGPKPCPFCGSTRLGSGGDDKVVGFWCLDCQATGPNHYGRYEWNSRADTACSALSDPVVVRLIDALQDIADGMGETAHQEIGRWAPAVARAALSKIESKP